LSSPVPCAMSRPGEYRWSSYRATGGNEPVPEFLETDWILGRFGTYRKPARRRYREFVEASVGSEPSPWENLRGQILLGTEEFVSRFGEIMGERERIEEIPKKQWYVGRPSLGALFEGTGGGSTADTRELSYRAFVSATVTRRRRSRPISAFTIRP